MVEVTGHLSFTLTITARFFKLSTSALFLLTETEGPLYSGQQRALTLQFKIN